MTSSLVLLSGNYNTTASNEFVADISPTLFKRPDGTFLFEAMVANAPVDNVTVVAPREQLGFWNTYKASAELKYGKSMNIFSEPTGRTQMAHEMSYYITSHVPSIFLNLEYDDIIFSTVSTYFENYSFLSRLMSKENAIVVSKVPEPLVPVSDIVRLGLTGRIEAILPRGVDESLKSTKPTLAKDFAFASVFKTTTNTLLENGIYRGGDFINTIRWLAFGKGVKMEAVKTRGIFVDCRTTLGLNYAQNTQILVSS